MDEKPEEHTEQVSSVSQTSKEERVGVEVEDAEKGQEKSQKVVSHDADEAMKAFAEGGPIELTAEDNKRLLKIIDWHLMPMMCVVYGLNYLDSKSLLLRGCRYIARCCWC